MSHRHLNLVRSLFQEPVNGNIHWRDVESLLHHVGAEVETLSGNRLHVRLGRAEAVLHRPHHGNTLDRSGVRAVRGFLAAAGITPSQLESGKP